MRPDTRRNLLKATLVLTFALASAVLPASAELPFYTPPPDEGSGSGGSGCDRWAKCEQRCHQLLYQCNGSGAPEGYCEADFYSCSDGCLPLYRQYCV